MESILYDDSVKMIQKASTKLILESIKPIWNQMTWLKRISSDWNEEAKRTGLS